MYRFLAFFLFFSIFSVNADNYDSVTEKRYETKNPSLFAKYIRAHELLNDYRGQQAIINEAQKYLDDILKADDQYAPAYREFGRLWIMKGSKNNRSYQPGLMYKAESSLLKAISLAPDYADAYLVLGHLYTKLLKFEEAKTALEKAEELGTDSPWLDNNWANYYLKNEDYDSAISRFKRVAYSKTNNTKAKIAAVRKLATLYNYRNEYVKARKMYDMTLDIEPQSAWAWGNYASQHLFVFGEIDEAITKAEKALSLMNYGVARLTLASAYCTKWALSDASNKVDRQRYLDNALAIVPDPKILIEETRKHGTTQRCASELIKYN